MKRRPVLPIRAINLILQQSIAQASPYILEKPPLSASIKVAFDPTVETVGTCNTADVPRSREDGSAAADAAPRHRRRIHRSDHREEHEHPHRPHAHLRDGERWARQGQDPRIYQGESRKAPECQLLGEFEFGGLRQARRGEVKIEVTFEIDTDGIVNVSAPDVESGQKTQTSITLSGGMSDADMAAAKARADNVDVRSR